MMNHENYLYMINWLNEKTKEYDEGHPSVTDKMWDEGYFSIQEYEYLNPDKISPDSPTQKVYFKDVSELKKVKHNHLMLSLNKTKDIEDIENFVEGHRHIAMAKMDGLTCSLHYEGGKLVSAETRGNGIEGEDVTHNAMVIPSIPKRINYKEPLTVDGEIICIYADFHNWSNEYKNPRNFAAGSIRLLDSKECAARNLTFIAWDVIEKNNIELSAILNWLEVLTFKVVPFRAGERGNIEKIIEGIKNASSAYPIDGIVFKYDSPDEYEEAGRTDHHFKGGLAYKFYDEEYETRLETIAYDVSRNGVLTPVAVFEPIDIDGTTVSRASLHNMSVMYDTLGRDPYCGERIKVIKANQIIPQITWADKRDYGDIISHGGVTCDRNGIDGEYMCTACFSYASIYTSDTGVEELICENPQCPGKLIQRLDHFCGKKGLDIKGLSEKTFEKLVDWGWINDLTDIPKLKKHGEEWMKKPGFSFVSVSKILGSIDDGFKDVSLEAFISGLGIPLVGTRVAKQICEHVETWKEFKDLINSKFSFESWDGFGYEMNRELKDYNYEEADKLIEYITFKPIEHQEIGSALEGKTFVITGKLVNYPNRQSLVDVIESAGGKVQSSVSSKTQYLINNDINSTSAKNKKAKDLNIPIITEEDLERMMS